MDIYRELDPTKEDIMTLNPYILAGTVLWPLLLAVATSGTQNQLSHRFFTALTIVAAFYGVKLSTLYSTWKKWLKSFRVASIERSAAIKRSTRKRRSTKRSTRRKRRSNYK